MNRIFDGLLDKPLQMDIYNDQGTFRGVGDPVTKGLKRGLDVSAVLVAFVLFLPLLLTIVAVVLLMQGRPLFIRHQRVGRNGALFPCFKFRTMVENSDALLRAHLAADAAAAAEWNSTRKLKNDPRVTPLGQVMRKLSIDEVPQLINVLRGEMSLVGPRPIVPEEVSRYGAWIDDYKRVRPGLTGLWQISGRNDVSYDERVQFDAEYVNNWSLGRDLSILVRTVPAIMAAKGSY